MPWFEVRIKKKFAFSLKIKKKKKKKTKIKLKVSNEMVQLFPQYERMLNQRWMTTKWTLCLSFIIIYSLFAYTISIREKNNTRWEMLFFQFVTNKKKETKPIFICTHTHTHTHSFEFIHLNPSFYRFFCISNLKWKKKNTRNWKVHELIMIYIYIFDT